MSKKIVFFSTPAYGHIISVYPVLEELVKRGNKVDWYCSAKYKSLVEKSGANFIEYAGDFDELYSLANITANFYNLFEYLLKLNKQCFLEYYQKIDKDVDLILYDSMCSFGKNIAQKLNIKNICLCTTLAYNNYTFTFSNMLLPTIKLAFCNAIDGIKLIKKENKFRKSFGIKKLDLMDLFVNKGDRTLVFSPNEFQPFAKTFDKSVIFVGTTIKNRINLDETRYKKYDIYISLGSIFTENRELLDEIIHSEYLKDKKVIINIGNLDIKSSKKNIELDKHTNQMELLKNCKLFINHGGLNSVYESIDRSVVQICIPQQEEQKMNAKIVQKLGIGICIDSFDEKKIEQVEKNISKYQSKTKQFSKIIKKYDGTENAIKVINELMECK